MTADAPLLARDGEVGARAHIVMTELLHVSAKTTHAGVPALLFGRDHCDHGDGEVELSFAVVAEEDQFGVVDQLPRETTYDVDIFCDGEGLVVEADGGVVVAAVDLVDSHEHQLHGGSWLI